MALEEESVMDARFGDYANADLAGYHIAVNADIREIAAERVEEDDPHASPMGAKGVGEIGIVGTAAAIANAVHHATGIRIRDLPITPEKLLGPGPERSLALVAVGAGHRLEQLERGGLRRRDEHLAADVLELREEARVHGDLVLARILQDDHGAAAGLAVRVLLAAEGGAGGRQHGDREVVPVRERVGTLLVGHLGQVVAVALGERGDRGPQRGLGEQVVR
jgi:hypothetical protein